MKPGDLTFYLFGSSIVQHSAIYTGLSARGRDVWLYAADIGVIEIDGTETHISNIEERYRKISSWDYHKMWAYPH